MRRTTIKLPREVARAIEETARAAQVSEAVVIEAALEQFGRLDWETKRQLVRCWWTEASELRCPEVTWWRGLARHLAARVRRLWTGADRPEDRAA